MTPVHDMRAAYGRGRVTPQRERIASAASRMPGAFTVDELVAAARLAEPGIGTATVYRAVAALEHTGFLERVGERGGSALYTRCHAGADHHHHLVCTGCGRVEAAACPLGPAIDAATSGTGFTVTRHEVTLYGLCPSCTSREERG